MDQREKEAALASLYNEYFDKIAHYVFFRLGNRNDAEDLAGEVFLKALKSLDSYKEHGVPMQSWLFRIAHNLVIDYRRKEFKWETVPLDTVQMADNTDIQEMAEAGQVLNKKSGAVRQMQSSALKTLRNILGSKD